LQYVCLIRYLLLNPYDGGSIGSVAGDTSRQIIGWINNNIGANMLGSWQGGVLKNGSWLGQYINLRVDGDSFTMGDVLLDISLMVPVSHEFRPVFTGVLYAISY